jgi:hypothetical protein
MSRNANILLGAILSSLLAGSIACKRDTPTGTTTEPGVVEKGDEAANPTAATDPKNLSGQKQRSMENCPSALPGVKTELAEVESGVELRFTASDESTVTKVRELARTQAAVKPPEGEIEHTGAGVGGGREGFCPIVHVGTTVSVEDIEGGARVTLKPDSPEKMSELRGTARARVDALKGS